MAELQGAVHRALVPPCRRRQPRALDLVVHIERRSYRLCEPGALLGAKPEPSSPSPEGESKHSLAHTDGCGNPPYQVRELGCTCTTRAFTVSGSTGAAGLPLDVLPAGAPKVAMARSAYAALVLVLALLLDGTAARVTSLLS